MNRVTLVYELDNPNAVVELLNNSESRGLIIIRVEQEEEEKCDSPSSYTIQ